MDYEKKYNETLAKMREWKKKYVDSNILSADGTIIKNLYDIFPELEESEGERIRKGLLKIFKQSQSDYWEGMKIKDIVAYLERQKEQNPAEWSEEDEIEMGFIIEHLNECKKSDTKGLSVHYDRLINWLKSLRPQPHWKPSEEQIDALERCVDYLDESDNEDAGMIDSLCHDLKLL